MFEVELRALIEDYKKMRQKLLSIAEPIETDEREATFFFFNPNKDNFDLRLRLQKNKALLSFKENISKTARKEIESEIKDPKALYEILHKSGFEIKMIIARIKHKFKYNKFEILLNKIIDWGEAIEVEVMIDEESKAKETENEIKEFIKTKLGIENLLEKEKLIQINKEYNNKLDFKKIKIEDVINYVNGELNQINLI